MPRNKRGQVNIELARQLFAGFVKPPDIKVDEPTGALVIGPLTISAFPDVEKLSTFTRYTLDIVVGSGQDSDITDLANETSFGAILAKAVGAYAEWQAYNTLDQLATEGYALELQAETEQLQRAEQEGRDYFTSTPIDQRTSQYNPYPYGIEHYRRWLIGFGKAEAEAVF